MNAPRVIGVLGAWATTLVLAYSITLPEPETMPKPEYTPVERNALTTELTTLMPEFEGMPVDRSPVFLTEDGVAITVTLEDRAFEARFHVDWDRMDDEAYRRRVAGKLVQDVNRRAR